jgi:two-component system, NtrC family, response regulator AtoC
MILERTDTTEFTQGESQRAELTARFFVEEPGRPPRVVSLARGRTLRIGRGEDQDVRLDDPRTSRAHAVLEFEGGRITVHDLGSSNGTWLGAKRVAGSATLSAGTLVRVGNTRIVPVPPDSAVRPETHGPIVGDTRVGNDVVSVDPATVALFALVRRLAASDLPVLVQGETGTGKEVVARTLHRYSPRANGPFIAVNCATLPEALAESELFGHERGAFTGALARKTGMFEAANGGVLVLDEVGELSPTNQARLLRALQERAVQRIGATRPVPVDVRVVCATNRDLAVEVARGRFREDLYFRLNGVTVTVPPLRERPRDVIPLARQMAAERGNYTLSDDFCEALQRYEWPGNVRELQNALDCAVALANGSELLASCLPTALQGFARPLDDASPLRSKMGDIERTAIVNALHEHNGNQSQAARVLGISRRALIYKMERYGLKALPRSARDA